VLISETARAKFEDEEVTLKRRWRFSAKGTRKDLKV
jgi:hypothetical protein